MFDRVVGLTHLNLKRMKLGSETWAQQFRNAMSVNGGDVEGATSLDYFMHFVTFPWKVCGMLVILYRMLGRLCFTAAFMDFLHHAAVDQPQNF